jgi:hypothetical protein
MRAAVRVAATLQSGDWLAALLGEVDAHRPGFSIAFRMNAARSAIRVGDSATALALLERASLGLPVLGGDRLSFGLGQLAAGLQAVVARVELDDHLHWVTSRLASVKAG